MPSKSDLNRVIAAAPLDLKQVRIPGLSKPFEQLTISELVQLRPGSAVAETWEVNAVTDNVSATTAAALEALGRIHKDRVISQVLDQAKLNDLRGQIFGKAGVFSGLSADAPAPGEVSLGQDDVFAAGSKDPFKA